MGDTRQRAIELKPARDIAIKFWHVNPDATIDEVFRELQQLGYVSRFSLSRGAVRMWGKKYGQPVILPKRILSREKKEMICEEIRSGETTTPRASQTYNVSRTSIYSWLKADHLPMPAKIESKEHIGAPSQPTWEQVVKAFPDRATLASFLLDGVLAAISEKNALREELDRLIEDNKKLFETTELITKDREKVMQELNNYLIKEKNITFGIDQAKRTLVPKKRKNRYGDF